MSVFETILKRRSIRKFKDTPVEDDKIKKILEAAIWAPSAGNMQPWVFIAVRNRKSVEKIKAVAELDEITLDSIKSVHKLKKSVKRVKLIGTGAKELASKIKDEAITTSGK